MGEQFFDDLARGLDDGTLSRRRALRLAGGALLAAVVPPLFPREADARRRISKRKRCKRKGGVYFSSGTCHCASTCSHLLSCNASSDCLCAEKADGSGGFCGDRPSVSASDCARLGCASPGQECIVVRDCNLGGVGAACRPPLIGCAQDLGCLNGTCQFTACVPRCGCSRTGASCSTNEECCSGQCNGGMCA